MQPRQSTLLLAVALIGAGAYAFLKDAPATETPHALGAPQAQEPLDDPGEETDPAAQADLEPDNEPSALEWTVPSTWKSMPNPSAMRLATYAVPHVASDTVDADLSVSRAGGDVEANIDRWAGQFAGGALPKRRAISVRGIPVILVDMEGTYDSSMGPAGPPHTGWALAGAIVQGPGLPYFFKMTGPAATVRTANAAFQGMIEGIRHAGEVLADAGSGDAKAEAARK